MRLYAYDIRLYAYDVRHGPARAAGTPVTRL